VQVKVLGERVSVNVLGERRSAGDDVLHVMMTGSGILARGIDACQRGWLAGSVRGVGGTRYTY